MSGATLPPRFDSPAQNGYAYPRPVIPQVKQERTKGEVMELKAARKAEIERRAMLLHPPLTPGVLSHMASFKAALQLIKPLDDDAWEILKPRLLSQRPEAEMRENERLTQAINIPEKLVEQPQPDITKRVTKDGAEHAWDVVQLPIRNLIGVYADELVRNVWADGEKVNKDNSPDFAAEVLVYVRQRFYAKIAEEAAEALASGAEPKVDPVHGPFTQKLILENMKWVFDTKIKPHTEKYRKELFICNGCDVMKFYGFEGIIQHYAAKHTTSLSLGTIVVHWRAEWPENPPFRPDPTAAKAAHHAASTMDFSGGSAMHPEPRYSASSNLAGGTDIPQNPVHSQALGVPQPHTNLAAHLQAFQIPGQYKTTAFVSAVPPVVYKAQVEEVARNVRDIWNATGGVKDLPGSVRIFTILYHVAERFKAQFSNEPSLAMFIDGLSNSKEMKPIRNVNGLFCRLCGLEADEAYQGAYGSRFSNSNTKDFSMPQLVHHFQHCHIDTPQEPRDGVIPVIDYTKDMVELPDVATISRLMHAAGMDDSKLQFIADALPSAFPWPLPKIGRIPLTATPSYRNEAPPRAPKFSNVPDQYINEAGSQIPLRGPSLAELLASGKYGAPSADTQPGVQQEIPNPKRGNLLRGSPQSTMRSEGVRDSHILSGHDQSGAARDRESRYVSTIPDERYASQNHGLQNYYPRPMSRAPERFEEHGTGLTQRDIAELPLRSAVNGHLVDQGRQYVGVADIYPDRASRAESRHEGPIVPRPIREDHLPGDLHPGEALEAYEKRIEQEELRKEESLRASWEAERIEGMRRMYQPRAEPKAMPQITRDEVRPPPRPASRSITHEGSGARNEYAVEDNRRLPAVQGLTFAQENEFIGYPPSLHDVPVMQTRSPEYTDHRFQPSNVVYHDDRQINEQSVRAPSRYVRYESSRPDNYRSRSRSPLYADPIAHPSQYRDRSPAQYSQALPQYQEPVYHPRTSQSVMIPAGPVYGHVPAPREGYYRVYTDEQQQPSLLRAPARQPQYGEPPQYELVRVSDPAGDYMIERPVRREQEPVYAAYEDVYARQSVYDAPVAYERAPVSRSDPAYYEEYDPRNPAPPPVPAGRQVRYE